MTIHIYRKFHVHLIKYIVDTVHRLGIRHWRR